MQFCQLVIAISKRKRSVLMHFDSYTIIPPALRDTLQARVGPRGVLLANLNARPTHIEERTPSRHDKGHAHRSAQDSDAQHPARASASHPLGMGHRRN